MQMYEMSQSNNLLIYVVIYLYSQPNTVELTHKTDTVRPQDTRPQAARTLTMHDFELGPKKFEMHVFGSFLL